MSTDEYLIRPAVTADHEAAFAVERAVWAPFNWLADGGVGLDYDPDLHLVAVHEPTATIVGTIDACGLDWDGDPGTLPPEGWRDVNLLAADGFATRPRFACALGASILPDVRDSGLAGRMLVALRDQAIEVGYEALLAPVRPTARARMPHLSIADYAGVRLPDGRHFDPWVRAHERVGGEIIGTTDRSMYWWGTREQWEEWTRMRLPENGSVLIDGSTGWLELTEGFGELTEDSVWLLHKP